jgi:hypothetical protein
MIANLDIFVGTIDQHLSNWIIAGRFYPPAMTARCCHSKATRPPTEAASSVRRLHRAATNCAPGGPCGNAACTPYLPTRPPTRPPILAAIHAHGLCLGWLRHDQRRCRDGNRCRRQPTKQSPTRNLFRHANLPKQVPQRVCVADAAGLGLAIWDIRSRESGHIGRRRRVHPGARPAGVPMRRRREKPPTSARS